MAKSRDNKDKTTKKDDGKTEDSLLTTSDTQDPAPDEEAADSVQPEKSDEQESGDTGDLNEKASAEGEAKSDEPEPADAASQEDDNAPDDLPEGRADDDTATDEQTAAETADAPADDKEAPDTAPAEGLLAPHPRSTLASASLVSDGMEPEKEQQPVAEAAEPDQSHDSHSDDDEEEHGRSFAARALTWLILLIAGGAIALWGGPKVAPHLPSGLGPVKAWLMPGTLDTEQRISEVESNLSARIEGIEPGVDAAAVDTAVSGAIADLEARFESEITALSDKVEASDSASIEGRLAQLETRIEGLSAQVEGLSGISTENTSGEELSAFAATVEGLRAELGAVAEKQGGLAQRIDDVEVAVNRKLSEAEDEIATITAEAEATKSDALARAALTTIEASIAAGEPYEAALAQLSENTDSDLPEGLTAAAGTGVSTLGALRSGFGDAAHAAIKASVQQRDTESVGGRLAAFIESQVATRSLTPQEGDSTDAILSRAEDALRRDNLAAALDELDGLSPAAAEAMNGWLSRARARVDAVSALNTLRGTFAASN